MGSQLTDQEPIVESAGDTLVPSRSHRGSRLWPLVALAFTTISLATSAFRVVASSIGSPEASTPVIAPADLVRTDVRESLTIDDDPTEGAATAVEPDIDVPPPRPVPSRPNPTPVPPMPTVFRGPTPPRPGPSAITITDRGPATPSIPVPAIKQAKPSPAATKLAAPVAAPLAKPKSLAKRIMVRDVSGKAVVSRIYGQDGDRVAVLLPDGTIGWPDGLTYTDKPFVAATIPEMRDRLLATEFAGFQSIETKHYLILYQGSKSFATSSSTMLENLYAHLTTLLNKRNVPVHEAEFPLVAIIFHNEDDFRKHKRVAADVAAYYEILSNRIFLYENSKRDRTAPEVSALQKPQTVAHEGTHQILHNIGVQPRLSSWPLWLIEGLAEYCATPKVGKNGVPNWAGLGQPNLPHLATMRDLDDPLASKVFGAGGPKLSRDPGQTIAEYLVTRTDLSPTDYALSWALTHYLALKRTDDFLDLIREMSEIPPLEKRSPDDHLQTFKARFGDNLKQMDTAVLNHLRKIKQIDALPYFAVVFEQQVGGRLTRRAMVSQSPSMVRQFIDNSTSPRGGEPHWQVLPHPTRARAVLAASQWFGGG